MTNTTTPLALTDEKISELWMAAYHEHGEGSGTGNTRVKRFARLIEAALALPPTDLSGAMNYTGPGDAWPLPGKDRREGNGRG